METKSGAMEVEKAAGAIPIYLAYVETKFTLKLISIALDAVS